MNTSLAFLHGREGSSKGFRATMLRGLFPGIVIPDFKDSLKERMAQLVPILAARWDRVIIGSNMRGLMGALFTCRHREQVKKLIRL